MKNLNFLSIILLTVIGLLQADDLVKTGFVLEPLKIENLTLGHLHPDLLPEEQCKKIFTTFGMTIAAVKRALPNERDWTKPDPSYEPATVTIEKNHNLPWFESRQHMEKVDYKRAFTPKEIVDLNLNRCGRSGFVDNEGLGTHSYPNWAGDFILTRMGNEEKGEDPSLRYFKLIKRVDGFWAIPGGMQNRIPEAGKPASQAKYEKVPDAILREIKEETGIKNADGVLKCAIEEGRATLVFKGFSDDPRNADRVMIATTVIGVDMTGWKKDLEQDRNNFDKSEVENPGEWVAENDLRISSLFAQHSEFIHEYNNYLKNKK